MNQSSRALRNNALHHANRWNLRRWFPLRFIYQHVGACKTSFSNMSQSPLATFMTLAVIGIALALPCGLFVVVQNAQQISRGWDDGTEISLYLKKTTSESRAQALVQELRLASDIASVDYIPAAQGLEDFKQYSGFDEVLNELEENPLPDLIVVHPQRHLTNPELIKNLVDQLSKVPEVDVAKLDMEWVKRLYRMLELGQHIIYGLAISLGFGVILIIGNTIRLATQNHRTEIKVIKLVGGTDAFIRRPFLYGGALYGALGSILAMVLVSLFLAWLEGPVTRLAALYNSHYTLVGLENDSILLLVACGALLGLLGSWLAVAKHLHEIEPH